MRQPRPNATKAEAEGKSPGEVAEATGVTTLDSGRPFDTSAEGRFLVFESSRALLGTGDRSAVRQIFEYDAGNGSVSRASRGSAAPAYCVEAGVVEPRYACDGNTANPAQAPHMVLTALNELSDPPTDLASNHSVSNDGAVVFMSRDALAPGAVSGTENLYEYEAGELYLVASGGAEPIEQGQPDGSRLLGIDRSGGNIFFTSTASLLPSDTNSQGSWYTARMFGGFPRPATAAPCGGNSCQPETVGQGAGVPAAGTATTAGGGNLKPPALARKTSQSRALQLASLKRTLARCSHLRRTKRKRCEAAARRRYRAQAGRSGSRSAKRAGVSHDEGRQQ